ncbi:MAG: CoA transferase, partial [bacterium]
MKGDALALRGLRVLDLATGIAGPYAAKMLREAGADVIKVEEPAGDPLRGWTATSPPAAEGEDSALFQFLNGGKAGLTVDLKSDSGRETLIGLAAEADLLIESFGPGGLEERGLAGLAEANPRLSIISLSWWGLAGPWADRPANEWTLQASIGMTARRGYPERGPVGSGGRFGEWSAGSCAALAALATWRRTQQTGQGEHIDVSVFESMLLCMTQYHTLDGQ